MKDLFTNGLNYFLITSAVTLVTTLLINSICHRLINDFAKKHKDKVTTSHYLFQTVRATVWIVGLTIIFRQIKPLSTIGNTILGATSIIAVAVGIAAQATFGNYIAGFFLAIHQPFKVGDIIFIKERGLSGTVKEITFRHTVLLTQEQTERVILPAGTYRFKCESALHKTSKSGTPMWELQFSFPDSRETSFTVTRSFRLPSLERLYSLEVTVPESVTVLPLRARYRFPSGTQMERHRQIAVAKRAQARASGRRMESLPEEMTAEMDTVLHGVSVIPCRLRFHPTFPMRDIFGKLSQICWAVFDTTKRPLPVWAAAVC